MLADDLLTELFEGHLQTLLVGRSACNNCCPEVHLRLSDIDTKVHAILRYSQDKIDVGLPTVNRMTYLGIDGCLLVTHGLCHPHIA